MSFYKEVPGRQTTLESTLKFDTTPTEGSTNTVTSEGVKSAIDGAVGDASAALQEQIDDIAEKAGSGYIPKGEATVATLNALSGQENGELYTMTDAGTLTDGSLAVVAGDTVAWDATNSVWYKAMNYALMKYGTNEAHNLPTTITAFRTGDVIPVDGPDGTAKMDAEAVLQIASGQNVVKSGSITGNYDYTLVQVYGKVGDVVSIDYSFGATSNLVVVPEGGSATILVNGDTSGHYDYTLTTASATFGVYSSTSDVSYTLSVKNGIKKDIADIEDEVKLVEDSNLYTTYSGTLTSLFNYNIVKIRGNVGDKVYIDYTTSSESNLVVVPSGGSATILKNGGTSGSVKYTMTASSATFGFFGSIGMTYTMNVRAGLSSEIRQCNERIDSLTNDVGSVKKYTGTLSSYDYNIAMLHGKVGDKVLLGFKADQEVNLVIGSTVVIHMKTNGWYEYTMVSESIRVGFYVTQTTNYELEIRCGVDGRTQTVADDVVNFKTKKLLVMGDSISTSPYYMKYLKHYFKEYKNTAVVSATWSDRSNTDSYDGNPTTGVAKGNVMGNQVQKIKNTPSLVSFAPDVILLAAGTNDSDSTGATLDESLFTDSNGFVSLGTPTFDSADTYMANRRTMAGAMRYCITELEKIYPNAQIFICTPIQSSQSIHQYVNTKNKQELQKAVGQRMSVNIIDVGGGCGIYGDFEWNGSEWTEEEPDSHAGRDLRDGLHPNDNGSKKMASCIFRELVSHFADTSEL